MIFFYFQQNRFGAQDQFVGATCQEKN
jgi:hypothetical protein